jgi:hypothetical protein
LERLELDEDRPLRLFDFELRFERVDPPLEREPVFFEPGLFDFFPERPEPESPRAIGFSFPCSGSVGVLEGAIPTDLASNAWREACAMRAARHARRSGSGGAGAQRS